MSKQRSLRDKRLFDDADDASELESARGELRRLEHVLQASVHSEAEDAVRPFLADRIVRRLSAGRRTDEEFFQGLIGLFRPVAVTCALILAGLLAHNLYISSQFDSSPSPVDAVLAIPDVTTASVFDAELYVEEELQ